MDNPGGRPRSTEDGSEYKGVSAGGGRSQAGAASGLPARGGPSGGPATEIIRKSSFQESSRLWHTSQGPPEKLRVQKYASYFGNLQLAPGLDYRGNKETDKLAVLKPYEEVQKRGPPMDVDRMFSRSSRMLRGRSYLFQHSQDPAGTGKPVGSVGISRVQQGAPAEPQTPARPAKGTADEYAASRHRSGARRPHSWSTHVSEPAQRLHGFRGFERPTLRRPEENLGQPGFRKGRFRMSHVNPDLLAKSSFSPGDAEKRKDSASSTARWFTSGSKDTHLRGAERIKEQNPDQRPFNTDRIPRFPGFDAPTREGAKPLSHKSDNPGKAQPGFRGFSLGNPQIWQPGKSQMHRWDSRTGGGSGEGTTTGELKREELKTHPKTSGSTEAGILPEIYGENGEIFTSLRTRLSQAHQVFPEFNHTTTPVNSGTSPEKLGTTGGQTDPGPVPGPEPGPEPGPPSKSHRSQLRGETKVMVSIPLLESVTYTDVLGEASFSSIDANVRSYDPANRKVRTESGG